MKQRLLLVSALMARKCRSKYAREHVRIVWHGKLLRKTLAYRLWTKVISELVLFV